MENSAFDCMTGLALLMANNGIVSVVHENKQQILQRIAAGEAIDTIAKSLGLADHSAIVHRFDDDPDYQAALKSSAWHKLQKREKELELADSNVTVTRADRLLGHARWMAEKTARKQFGDDKSLIAMQLNANGAQVSASGSGIQITFVAAQPVQCNTIDGSVVESKDTK